MARKPAAPGKPKGTFVQTTVEIEGRSETRIVELPAFDPAPWDASAQLAIVGARVPRMDAEEKVTGRARYTADVARPGMLYAVVLRAAVPRGTIRRFDASRALEEWERRFSAKRLDQADLPEFAPPAAEQNIVSLVVAAYGAAFAQTKSRGEVRRLIEQGSVQLRGEKIRDPQAQVKLRSGDVLRLDKTRAVRVQ